MMIEALILVHLWSLVVAGIAWVLQRDGDGRVGTSFPASKIWLSLIVLSILPGALYLIPFGAAISIPKIEAFDLLPVLDSGSRTEGPAPLNYLAAYMGLSALLMSRTLWRWARLQSLPLVPTAEPDIFTTTVEIPPLTLSWPRRAVVIPLGFEAQAPLLRHERAHIQHRDAELTLLLLLIQDMMLRGPGINFLVRQWRLSIELRADYAATKTLSPSERKDYAALLLHGLRSSGKHAEARALPCPTAHLMSRSHRSVKMRLIEIMESSLMVRKRRWGAALLLTALGASAIGLMSAAASTEGKVVNAESGQVEYVKRTSLKLPASCTDFSRDDIKTAKKELMINGRLVTKHLMRLGTVILSHDVRRDGSIYNPRVLGSTHTCFEAEAKAAIIQWMAEPQEFETKDVAVKLHFEISGATPQELELQLNDFLQ